MRPRIGITLSTDTAYAGYRLRKDYCHCLLGCGGSPLLLPDLPETLAEEALDGLEGLLLSGGGDFPPQCYGMGSFQAPTARDLWELALLRAAWQRGLPILGICRGCQGLNIALGGDLIPDLPRAGGYGQHQQQQARQQRSHMVELLHPRLQQLYGRKQLWVNSFHHQGLGKLAPGLLPAALAPDGLCEAVLSREDGRFALGLQWHPEALQELPPFLALLKAARKYMKQKQTDFIDVL
ncbi:MAG: gamma-glutamyl-gamma-aminobutyrate hydrolase family protein [Bacillota bacterium]|nr:gamma-glutamyl-gamma-aminobutyrate hydrolase family protein [Bacillota bacterium]